MAYAYKQNIPQPVAASLMAALLVEGALFLAHGSEAIRERICGCCTGRKIATGLFFSALLPYCIYSATSGTFQWTSLAWLVLIAGFFSFTYAVLPDTPIVDFIFVVAWGAVLLTDRFELIYVQVFPKLPGKILGDLMLARVCAISLFSIRGMEGTAYGWIPSWSELKTGLREFCYFIPVGAVLVYLTGFAKLRPFDGNYAKVALSALGVGVGIHLLVSLREELMVRGLLQPLLQQWTGSPRGGMFLCSVMFGMSHLWFAHKFPNWKFAILATAAGWFYGRAYAAGRSVRAAMVPHTLVVVFWKVFLY